MVVIVSSYSAHWVIKHCINSKIQILVKYKFISHSNYYFTSFACIGWTPPHHCSFPEGQTLNETIPQNEDGSYDKCRVYVNGSDLNATEKCSAGWDYYNDGYATIVTEVTFTNLPNNIVVTKIF